MGVLLNNQNQAKPLLNKVEHNALLNQEKIWLSTPPTPQPVQLLPGTYGASVNGYDYYDTGVKRATVYARGSMSYKITQAGYYSIELAGGGGGFSNGTSLSVSSRGNPGALVTGTNVYIATGYLAFVIGGGGGNSSNGSTYLASAGGGGGSILLFPSGSEYWAWFAGGGGGGVGQNSSIASTEVGGGGGGHSGAAGTSQGTGITSPQAGQSYGVGGNGGTRGTGTAGVGGSSMNTISSVMRPDSELTINIPTYSTSMINQARIGGKGASAATSGTFYAGWSKWATASTLSSFLLASVSVEAAGKTGVGGEGGTGTTTATMSQTGWLTLTFLHS
jgi:hypothetical protein